MHSLLSEREVRAIGLFECVDFEIAVFGEVNTGLVIHSPGWEGTRGGLRHLFTSPCDT